MNYKCKSDGSNFVFEFSSDNLIKKSILKDAVIVYLGIIGYYPEGQTIKFSVYSKQDRLLFTGNARLPKIEVVLDD